MSEVKQVGDYTEPRFDTFQEAFDYCREVDAPVRVSVDGTRYKLYPSGRAETLQNEADGEEALSVRESYEQEGTWSWLCMHGRYVEACWACMGGG